MLLPSGTSKTGWRRRRDLTGDEEAKALIEERYQPHDPLKRGLQRQWATNISFLAGYQYHRVNELGQATPPPSPQRFRVRDQRNLIRAYHDRRVAHFSGFIPEFKVRPNSEEADDQLAAESNGAILKHYWRKTRMNVRLHDHAHWRGATGNAFVEVMWDPTAGDQFVAEMADSLGTMKETLIAEGDLRLELHSPFEITADPIAKHPEDLEWILITKLLPMEWAERHYPDRIDEIEMGTSSGYVGDTYNERLVAGLLGPQGYYSSIEVGSLANGEWCVMHKLYQRNTPQHPSGRLVVAVNDVIVHNDANPHPKHMIPVVWSRDLVIPGRLWGQSEIDNQIDPQRNYNRLVSGRLSHILATCYAKILEPAVAGLSDSTFITEYGEKIRYYGNQVPTYLEPPQMPRDTDAEMAQIKSDLDDISSSYATSRGKYTGKLSGTAMVHLIEQDQKSIEPAIALFAEEISSLGCHMLEYLQAYASDERIIKVLGKNRIFQTQAFRGQDIRGNTDVYIEVDSMMPKSKTMALEELHALGNLGILNPQDPRDRSLIWSMLQREVDEPLIQDKNLDRRGAMLENHLMSMGIPIPPAMAYEDQDIHVSMHTNEMKQEAVKNDPAKFQLYKQHLDTHLEIVYPQQGRGLVAQTPGQEPAAAEQGAS